MKRTLETLLFSLSLLALPMACFVGGLSLSQDSAALAREELIAELLEDAPDTNPWASLEGEIWVTASAAP